MGKALNCIKMLELLGTGRVYKVSELANLIETNPRNIIEYKRELDEMGYYITSIPGRYGGLKLESKNIFPSLSFSEDEKNALRSSYEYMMSVKEFTDKDNYEKAMGKVLSNFDNVYEDITPIMHLNKNEAIYNVGELENKLKLIKRSIRYKQECIIEYMNYKGNVVFRTIRPYELYIYNNSWFVLADCIETKKYTHFKLNRMQSIKNSGKKFNRDIFYKKSDYFDEEGYKKNDEWFDIKLKVSGYFVDKIKQEKLGKNQHIEYIDKNNIILSVSMQYKFNVISFAMSMGSLCEVIEPLWLKEQVIKISKGIVDKYQE